MNKIADKLMYSCDQVVGFVYDYFDSKLSFFTRKRFELHLKACKGCKDYVALYASAANPAEFLKDNPLPEELKSKTLAFLEAEGILNKE